MKKNLGPADRVIRFSIAVAIAVLYVMGVIGGTLAVVLGIVALALAATSMLGWCPLYVPFRISTRKRPAAGAAA